jgi:hypothetical protein
MSVEVWQMSDLDDYARKLGYWIVHGNNGFLVHRFDQPKVGGYWCSTEEAVREHLEPIAALPCWRLPLADNSMVQHHKYGVVVTDDAGRWFEAPAYRGDGYIHIHAWGRPPIGNWEQRF